MTSAAARRECRGAHLVRDYEHDVTHPTCPLGRNDAEWMKHTPGTGRQCTDHKPVRMKPLTAETVPPEAPYILSPAGQTRSKGALASSQRRGGTRNTGKMANAHSPSTATTPTRTPSPYMQTSRSNSTVPNACCSTS